MRIESSGKPDAWKLARPVWGWGRGAIPRPTPLRTLLVFVTLCAIACSWVAVKRQQEKQQREALARIEELVGSLSDPQDDKPSQQFSTSPFWDCDAFGFRYLGSLYLTGTRTTDSTLRQLKGLPELTRLHLDFTKVTDVGLENLKGLTQLAYLDLADTPNHGRRPSTSWGVNPAKNFGSQTNSGYRRRT